MTEKPRLVAVPLAEVLAELDAPEIKWTDGTVAYVDPTEWKTYQDAHAIR